VPLEILAGGDTCGSPTVIPSVPFGPDAGDTTGAADNIRITNCPGPTKPGPDHIYSFTVVSGSDLTFALTTSSATYDPAIYIRDSCSMGGTCVSSSDTGIDGQPETIHVTNLVAGTYYFYIDSVYDAGEDSEHAQGPYSLEVTGTLGTPSLVTLPAAASLHGAGSTFFHSDVSVFNPSATQATTVTARYRCSTGACGNAVQTFTLSPRQMRVFEDIVGTLFVAPETGGAVEFSGSVLVDSRLYTPSRPAPTTGMYVPGLSSGEAYAEAVLTSLSYSANPSTGFRTNVGVYNGNDVAQTVTFTLYSPQGVQLGQTLSQFVPARTPAVQINNIAKEAGITADVPSFYCVVRGDGVRKNYAYAAVLDNQSQDLIFVKGAQAQVP
jgi:hypothetical protein